MGTAQSTRAVIFDFNGTISNDEQLLQQIFDQLLADLGCAVPEAEYYRDFAGLSDHAIIERALRRRGLEASPQHVQDLLTRKTELYKTAVADHLPITPDAAEFVRASAARVPIAIASGAPREEVATVLGAAGLLELFTATVCLEDVQRGKPDPEAYETALGQLNQARGNGSPFAPGEILVFEDADPGVQAAKAALMRCVVLRTPAYIGVPVPADQTIEHLDPALIDTLL